jgi:chemotaxis protein histidine kinase CheA
MKLLIVESKEHLETIEPDLMELEENPEAVDPEAINRIFRAVHSIKGGFGFFSLKHVVELAHAMENVMGLIRDGELTVQSEIVDVLLSGADKLRVLIDDVRASESIPIDEEVTRLSRILDASGHDSPAMSEAAVATTMEQADDPDTAEPVPASTPSGKDQTSRSLRVKVDLLDDLMNLTGELVLSRNRIKRALADKLSTALAAGPKLNRLQRQLAASRERLAGAGQRGAKPERRDQRNSGRGHGNPHANSGHRFLQVPTCDSRHEPQTRQRDRSDHPGRERRIGQVDHRGSGGPAHAPGSQ